MSRSLLDRLISYIGFALAIVLLLAGILLTTAHNMVRSEVTNQLVSQKITMPSGPALDRLPAADKAALEPFAGQPMNTGAQAKAFADHYIQASVGDNFGSRTSQTLNIARRPHQA